MTIKKLIAVAVLALGVQTTQAAVLVLHADDGAGALVATALSDLGLVGTVDVLDVTSSTPVLGDLTSYDAIFAYTNFFPQNGDLLGDVLADYVDAGGGLLLATYGFSDIWDIGGRMQTNGYSPLVNNGTNGNPGTTLNAVLADPIFDGLNLNGVMSFSNSNYAIPGLDAGATLLADNGGGVNMIARNALGNIIGMNIFPRENLSADAVRLYSNALLSVQRVPEPATLSLLGIGLLVFGFGRRRVV